MAEKVVEVPGVGNVSFPDTMSDDAISAVIKKQVLPKPPVVAPAPRSDDRTATEVMQDQAAQVLKGIPEAITGIPASLKALGGAGLQMLTGGGTSKAQQVVQGALSPATVPLKGLGALAFPSTFQAPSREDWEGAARGAGAMLGSAELPNVLSAPPVKAITDKIAAAPGAAVDAVKVAKDAAIDAASPAPVKGMVKALRPKNTTLDFETDMTKAMPELKAAEKTIGAPITDINTLDQAKEAAISGLVKQQKTLVGETPIAVSGKPIAEAIANAIPEIVKTESPETAAALKEWATETYDKDFTVQKLNELRKDANASANSYYGKLPNQQMVLDRGLDSAIKKAKADAIRSTLYDALDTNAGTGSALRDVNQRIKSLLTVSDIIDRRYNVEMRQAIQNLPQQAGKIMLAGKAVSAVKNLLTGNVLGAGGDVLEGLAGAKTADFIKELNSTNGQIASAFRRFTDEPAPITVTPPTAKTRLALQPASGATVQPQTLTGSATPGQPLNSQGWRQPSAIALPQQPTTGLPRDLQTNYRTAFSRWFGSPQERPESAVQLSDLGNMERFIQQERAAGRTGIVPTRPSMLPPSEPPVIDVTPTRITPSPITAQASPLRTTLQIGTGSGAQFGRPAIPMPAGDTSFVRGVSAEPAQPMTLKDLLAIGNENVVRDSAGKIIRKKKPGK